MAPAGAALLLAALLAAGGCFALGAAVAGWEWFFRSANVRVLVGRMSRRSARMVYGAIGLALIGAAVAMVMELHAKSALT